MKPASCGSRPGCHRRGANHHSPEPPHRRKADSDCMMTAPPRRSPARAMQLAAPLRATAMALSIVAGLYQPSGADAATVPQFLPNRDVEVQYTVTAPGQSPHDYELSFSAESKRARINDAARGIW